MKRVAFLILVLATFYLAGMFHYAPLLMLCGIEILLIAFSILLPRYFKRKLNASFETSSEVAEAGTEQSCKAIISYTGKLPVSRLKISVFAAYCSEKRGSGQMLYTACERGETDLPFRFKAEYCGLVTLRIKRLVVYDYLALFSAGKAVLAEKRMAVFPSESALRIESRSFQLDADSNAEGRTVDAPGDAHYEIRQIREYRAGDSNRHIHWSLSSKTDSLWIKEYEREADTAAWVTLNTAGFCNATQAKRSNAYILLSALVLGLLKNVSKVCVCWQADASAAVKTEISNIHQCRDMLLSLYKTEFADKIESPTVEATQHSSMFRLDLSMRLFLNDELLCSFTEANLAQEIKEKTLIL